MLQVEDDGAVVKFCAARPFFGRPWYRTAAYWVDGLLIDTTCAHTARELLEATAARPLAQIVNTHCHEDHIGANGLLQRRRGPAILAHPLALPVLADPHRQYLQLYRRVFWGRPEPSQGRPIGAWVETEHHRFQVIPTPGHCPDHIALYEPAEGWLFSGDAYIGGRDLAARPDYDIYAIIDSLKVLAALPLSRLYPASGTVRTQDPAADLRRKIAQMEEMGAAVRRLHEQGLSVGAIQRRLLGREGQIACLTLGHFRGRYLIEGYLRERPAAKSAS